MKKLKLIYNPFSGDKSFKFELDSVISEFQSGSYETHIFRTCEDGDLERHMSEIAELGASYYDVIVISGGDGSINIAVNGIMKHGITSAIGVIPSGTANDFAAFLKIPQNAVDAVRIITDGHISEIDIGRVNDMYFVNVCGAGYLTNISQQIDKDFKDALGKLAYYIKGIEQAPKFMPFPVRITSSEEVYEENIYLFIVLNSGGTGGFNNLVKDAVIDDGLFDFIALKAGGTPLELFGLVVKVLNGDFLTDPNILYFRDGFIKIETDGADIAPVFTETDIDGEQGPDLPVTIKNLRKAIRIFTPAPDEIPDAEQVLN
ncbi:lipid kinase [Clostridia bacterium]|nr:lipid kinase [Clostridia bacterium]